MQLGTAVTSPDPILIGLVGDYDAGVTAHRAIPRALALAERAIGADRKSTRLNSSH